MSARLEPAEPETEDLRRVVEGVTGVSAAEIDTDEAGRHTIRVHLDGSRAEQSVLDDVRGAVTTWRRPAMSTRSTGRQRRAGLGKGLDSLLAEAMTPSSPSLAPALARVTTVQAEYGASVQATDTLGTLAVVFVGAGGIDAATVGAVATVRDIPAPIVLAVTSTVIAGHDVVTVVLEAASGEVRVGSAPMGQDRLLAVGEAAWRALGS